MVRLAKLMSLIFAVALLSSCTRQMEKKSNVSLDLSPFFHEKFGAQAATDSSVEINMMAINITTGGELRTCRLESHDGVLGKWEGDCVSSVPSDPLQGVTMNAVPTGAALIQILVVAETVTEDPVTGEVLSEGEVFQYGETSKNLTTEDPSVKVIVEAAQKTQNKEGTVSGRYLLADGTPYTGYLDLMYAPPSGNPMAVFRMSMFAGWFNIHLLDGIPLQYKMVGNNRTLWGRTVALGSALWRENSQAIYTAESPEVYFSDGDSEDGRYQVVGFWQGGSPMSSASVCYDNTAKYADHKYVDAAGSVTLSWPSNFVTTGGSGACSLVLPAVDASQIKVAGEYLLDGGGAPFFHGPYMKFDTGKGLNYASASVSGSELTVNWEYLPDVTSASNFLGTRIFYSSTYDGEFQNLFEGAAGFNCSQLSSDPYLKQHFSESKSAKVTNMADEEISVTVTGDLANVGRVIVCPIRGYNDEGKEIYYSSSVGAAVFKSPATTFQLTGLAEVPYTYVNSTVCTPFEVKSLDANGSPGRLPHSSFGNVNTYAVTLAANYGNFYTDPACTSGSNGVYNLKGEMDFIYYKSSTIVSGESMQVHSHPGEIETLSSGYANFNINAKLGVQGTTLRTLSKSYSIHCIPIIIALTDTNGVPTSDAADIGVTLSSDQADGEFYADYDSTCSSSQTDSAIIYNSKSLAMLNYDPAPVDGTNLVTYVNFSSFDSTPNPGAVSMQILKDPTASYMHIDNMGSNSVNVCNQIKFSTYINMGVGQSLNTYPPGDIQYQFTVYHQNPASTHVSNVFEAEATYNDAYSSCANSVGSVGLSGTVTQGVGTQFKDLYFKTDSDGTYIIEAEDITYGGAFSSSTTIYVSP